MLDRLLVGKYLHITVWRPLGSDTTEIYTHVGTRRLKTVHGNTHPVGVGGTKHMMGMNMETYLLVRTLINWTILFWTVGAAVFLAKANLGLTPSQIAELVSTKFDYNPNLITSLTQQHSETKAGLILLLGSVSFQTVNSFWPRIMGESDSPPDILGFVLALLCLPHWCPEYCGGGHATMLQ